MKTVAVEARAFVLSANQCLRKRNRPDWINKDEPSKKDRNDKRANSGNEAGRLLRRSSTITKTEYNHEITWPLLGTKTSSEQAVRDESLEPLNTFHDEDSGDISSEASLLQLTRQKSIITKTEEDHEIAWPNSDSKPHFQISETFGRSSLGSPSSRRFSAIPIEEGKVKEASMTITGFSSSLQRQSPHTKLPGNHVAAPVLRKSRQMPNKVSGQSFQSLGSRSGKTDLSEEDFACRGGSCIISPTGAIIAGPLWEVEDGDLIYVTADFEDCERGRLDMDVAGSYARGDAFENKVRGLNINPPP